LQAEAVAAERRQKAAEAAVEQERKKRAAAEAAAKAEQERLQAEAAAAERQRKAAEAAAEEEHRIIAAMAVAKGKRERLQAEADAAAAEKVCRDYIDLHNVVQTIKHMGGSNIQVTNKPKQDWSGAKGTFDGRTITVAFGQHGPISGEFPLGLGNQINWRNGQVWTPLQDTIPARPQPPSSVSLVPAGSLPQQSSTLLTSQIQRPHGCQRTLPTYRIYRKPL